MNSIQENYLIKALAKLAFPDARTNFRKAGIYQLIGSQDRDVFRFYYARRLDITPYDPTAVVFELLEYKLIPFEYHSPKRSISILIIFVPERNCIAYNRLVVKRS